MNKTASSIAREYFPHFNHDELEHIIWSNTGFPHFWDLNDGDTSEECFRKQLNDAKHYYEKHGVLPDEQ